LSVKISKRDSNHVAENISE